MSEATPMIAAFQKDEALLEDIHRSNSYDEHFRLWWLGQSGFLLQYKQRHLLFDPYLSDSLSEKYAGTDKPHLRIGERVVDPAELGFVDIVTSSHNHTDHLDRETLLPILTVKDLTHFVVPEANRHFVSERLSLSSAFAIGLNDGEVARIDPFEIVAVPAAHNTVERDDEGRCRFLGYVVKFGPWCVYHSGDTKRFDGMEELLREHHIDVALLPINGDKPERRVAGNLSATEAAALGKTIGAGLVIPHHFHLFAFNTEDPAVFAQACAETGTAHRVLRLGERFSSAEWPGFAERVAAPVEPSE
ncbi:MAG: MBL fold metallo-hydrolase [Bryobacterales bacterium]|nr:MBL fold metallo-hydrolase [Bryobacterales bacterium]